MSLVTATEVLVALGFPALAIWGERHSRIVRASSPVVLSYLAGMLLGNQPWLEFSDSVALQMCDVTVALAIPMLLFSVDIKAWLGLVRGTVLSFVLVMVSAVGAGFAGRFLVSGVEHVGAMSGMLVGVYIGGTPNMAAVGKSLGVPSETFVLLNAADMVASFSYLLFILTLAPRLLSKVLPVGPSQPFDSGWSPRSMARLGATPKRVAASFGAALGVVGVSVWLGSLVPKPAVDATIMLGITTGSLIASMNETVRSWKHCEPIGRYLLLVFAVAMGFTTDFGELFSAGPMVLVLTFTVLYGSVMLHLLGAWLLRLERDTVIITSAAGVFGPHMVGPVAMSLKNRLVLVPGLVSGLVGYAAGNYLGVLVAWLW